MKRPRVTTLIILIQFVVLLVCLGFLGHTLIQNYFLKSEAKRYAATAGFDQATRDFLRGDYCLYEIKTFKFGFNDNDSGVVPTDGTIESAGKMDGRFRVDFFLVDRGFPKGYQEIQQAFVDGHNDHMRQYFDHSEWFDKNGLRIPMHELHEQTNGPSSVK